MLQNIHGGIIRFRKKHSVKHPEDATHICLTSVAACAPSCIRHYNHLPLCARYQQFEAVDAVCVLAKTVKLASGAMCRLQACVSWPVRINTSKLVVAVVKHTSRTTGQAPSALANMIYQRLSVTLQRAISRRQSAYIEKLT
jgi:hypothetical protein